MLRHYGTGLRAQFTPTKWAEQVSARHLVGMSSGLQDFEVEPHLRFLQNAKPSEDLDNPLNAWKWTNKTIWFEPGSAAVYSSFNFEVAGLLLAAIDNASGWDAYDQRRGALPPALSAALRSTAFPAHGPCGNFRGGTWDGENGTAAHGYQRAWRCESARGHPLSPQDVERCEQSYPGAWSDVINMSCTSGWACGNLAASPPDVSAFMYHLHGLAPPLGPVVKSQALLSQMTKFKPLCIQDNPVYPCEPHWSYGLATIQGIQGDIGCDLYAPGSCSNCSYRSESGRVMDCYAFGHGGEEYGYVGNAMYA